MARVIRDQAPDVWFNAIRFSQKAAVIDFVDDEPAFLVSEFYFNKPYQYVVTRIGVDPDQPGVIYALDVDADLDMLRNLSDAALGTRLQKSPKLVRKIKSNSCPGIESLSEQGWHGRDLGEIYDTAERIKSDSDFCARLVAAFKSEAAVYAESEFVEELIYAGFPSSADHSLMDQFHETDWGGRLPIVESFEDRRLRELGRRLIYFHAPDALPDDVCTLEARSIALRLTGHGYIKPPWITIPAADAEAAALECQCSADDLDIVVGLRTYFSQRLTEAMQLLDAE